MNKKIHPRGAQAPLVGSKLKLHIEKLAVGGAGVARHEGFVVFVPLAAPHDELLVEITVSKKNFAEGKILEVLKAGPSRRTPPCPVAMVCGGCNWQQIQEQEQCAQKELLVQETIRKFNPELTFEYLPIRPSPRSLRYRNRIQPKYRAGKFGFFARNSHDIVDIVDCPITENILTDQFAMVRSWIAQKNPKGTQRLEMYLSAQNEVRYGLITDEDDGIGFSQVNRFQNEELVQTALDWAGPSDEQDYPTIYDLYAGSGNFTFPLARKYSKSRIIGVELNPKLVTKAQSDIREARMEFCISDVEKYVLKSKIGPNDLVFLDPPRAGTSQVIMEKLASARPKKIIYISCHPVSLARDLKWFFAAVQAQGVRYKLARIQAFEMFPQTDHVETIAELRVDS